MIKLFALIPKRQDITDEQFHAHWRGPHAELARNLTSMRRYVQAHRVHAPELGLTEGPYEGIAEVWFADLSTALAHPEDPNYQRYLVPDEPNFVDQEHLRFVLTSEDVVLDAHSFDRDEQAFKVTLMLRRRSGTAPEAFRAQVAALPDLATLGALDVLRCHRALAVPESYAGDGPPFDAFVELWWRDARAFESARRGAPEAWEAVVGSLSGPSEATVGMVIEENRVLWP